MAGDPEVLHLRSSAGLYGAEYVVLGLQRALPAEGIASTLLCLDNYLQAEQSLYERARALDLSAQRLPCRSRFDFGTVRALRRVLAEHPHAILHVHDYKSAFYAWLARGRTRRPVVATSHGHFAATGHLRIYNRLELWLMRRFDRVCIVSAAMQAVLAGAGVPSARVTLVENGIDTERFRPDVAPLARAQWGIPEDAFVFGSAMRLTEQKNPTGLVEAFARVADAHAEPWLVVAGDGPLRGALLARAAELGVAKRVRLLGARTDTEHFYPMLDCFVLASHYEGLPMALLEAMAAARPVVCTAVGQIPAVLEGLDAQPVPAGNVDALGAAMRATLERRQATHPELRARVRERYSVARMAREYAAIYREVWRTHGHAPAH